MTSKLRLPLLGALSYLGVTYLSFENLFLGKIEYFTCKKAVTWSSIHGLTAYLTWAKVGEKNFYPRVKSDVHIRCDILINYCKMSLS